jgi:hypothetical protein
MRVETYSDQFGLVRGLATLRQQGLTPRGLLFLALNGQGRVHLVVPKDPHQLDNATMRVGEKLTLRWPDSLAEPQPQRLFHFDSIHALRDDFYVVNGDRRLSHPGNAMEVGSVVSRFLRSADTTSAFFGCTPHQPGTWLQGGNQVVALHDYGIVEAVPVPSGLLARRLHDHRLYLTTFAEIARTGSVESWQPVYASPLGNILMVERRVVQDRLVLSCERGLVEVELGGLPEVFERALLPFAPATTREEMEAYEDQLDDMPTHPAVLGRLAGEAFVLTRGRPQPWGLLDIAPAELWSGPTGELKDIQTWLSQAAISSDELYP